MGASVTNLVMLISKDFTVLVLIAFVVSAPFAWWGFNIFLQRYEYRIDIGYWVIGAVGGFALLLTVLIVSTQALKAAMANPTKSLRSE
jgi:hypothetical protein